jgi:serine/threonine protein kinase
VPAERRSCLYYLQTWHEGATLQRMLDCRSALHRRRCRPARHPPDEGLSALHRLDVAHRDIKPANIHLGRDGRLRILDLGVALSLRRKTMPASAAREPQLHGARAVRRRAAGPAHDLYAAGVTLYHLLTRKYPYGEIEPFSIRSSASRCRRHATARTSPAGWKTSCSRRLPRTPRSASKPPRNSCWRWNVAPAGRSAGRR